MKTYYKRSVVILMLLISLVSQVTGTESKRIEVYGISQQYWDVEPGDTLGEIVKQLLPDNPAMRNRLMQEILQLNPSAFSRSNPDNLKANIRLWLPNHAPLMQVIKDKRQYDIKSFSWGQVYKPRRD